MKVIKHSIPNVEVSAGLFKRSIPTVQVSAGLFLWIELISEGN